MHIQSESVADFNRWSRTYETSWMQRSLFDRVHEGVLGLVVRDSAPGVILDAGCGTGRLLRKARIRYPGARLIGVDPAEGMIEKARQMLPDAAFSVGSAEALPLPDASVDLAVSTISYHHWKDQEQGVREIRRVLRPGGQFLLADMVLPAFLVKVLRHGHIRTAGEVKAIFGRAGLEVLSQHRLLLGLILVTVGIRR